MKNKRSRETFEPQNSYLNMRVKDAYKEVLQEQLKLSVAVQNLLPRDINKLNLCISKVNGNNQDSSLDSEEERDIIANIRKLDVMFKTLAESKACRIVAVHRVITNKG